MPTVATRSSSAVNPKPPLAVPSRRCRSAALIPPFHACAILSATFLPPAEEEAAYIQAHGTCHFVVSLRRRIIRPFGQSGFIAVGQWQCQDYYPTRSVEIAVFTNTPYVSRLRSEHRRPRAFLAEAPLLSASAKNRFGFRVDRLFPPTSFRFLHATFALLRWHGAPLRLRSQTIFGDYIPAFPDTAPASRCRAAYIPSPTRNLRLLFRAVDAMPPLSILRSARADNLRTPPTHRGI